MIASEVLIGFGGILASLLMFFMGVRFQRERDMAQRRAHLEDGTTAASASFLRALNQQIGEAQAQVRRMLEEGRHSNLDLIDYGKWLRAAAFEIAWSDLGHHLFAYSRLLLEHRRLVANRPEESLGGILEQGEVLHRYIGELIYRAAGPTDY